MTDGSSVGTLVYAIGKALATRRWIAQNEAQLQTAVLEVLSDRANLPGPCPIYELVREHVLSETDRVDFALVLDIAPPNLVALEIKVQGATTAVARQIQRYTTHREVAAVILATTTARLAMSLHGTKFGGVPVYGLAMRRM